MQSARCWSACMMSMLGWVTFSVLVVDIIGFDASCSVHLICLHNRFERDVFIARYNSSAHRSRRPAAGADGIGACNQPVGHLHVVHGPDPAIGIACKSVLRANPDQLWPIEWKVRCSKIKADPLGYLRFWLRGSPVSESIGGFPIMRLEPGTIHVVPDEGSIWSLSA